MIGTRNFLSFLFFCPHHPPPPLPRTHSPTPTTTTTIINTSQPQPPPPPAPPPPLTQWLPTTQPVTSSAPGAEAQRTDPDQSVSEGDSSQPAGQPVSQPAVWFTSDPPKGRRRDRPEENGTAVLGSALSPVAHASRAPPSPSYPRYPSRPPLFFLPAQSHVSTADTMGCCSGRCTLIFICTLQLVSLIVFASFTADGDGLWKSFCRAGVTCVKLLTEKRKFYKSPEWSTVRWLSPSLLLGLIFRSLSWTTKNVLFFHSFLLPMGKCFTFSSSLCGIKCFWSLISAAFR